MKNVIKTSDKYKEIRNKLDDFNYKQPFDMSSIQLIETLLTDIKKFSQENAELKSQNGKFKNLNENLKLNLKALKSEMDQLVKENNNLHREYIEMKRDHFSSSNAKEMEIKKLSEEKQNFRFLFLNLKEKFQKVENSNEELKKIHSNLLSKIYESNMSEQSLRKLYETEVNFLNSSNSKIFSKNQTLNLEIPSSHKEELGIFLKQRGINSSPLNMNVTNSFIKHGDKNLLKEIILETFGKNSHQSKKNEKNNSNSFPVDDYLHIENKKTESLKNMKLDNIDEYKKRLENLETSNECLKKQIKNLELENSQVTKLKKPSFISNLVQDDSIDYNSIIAFMKKEKLEIIEKYEKRLEIVLNESKFFRQQENLLNKNRNLKNKNKTFIHEEKKNSVKKEFSNSISVKLNSSEQLSEILRNYRTENFALKEQNENLFQKIKDYEKNFIEKKFLNEKEESYNEKLCKFREIVEEMNFKLKENSAFSNSEKILLINKITSQNEIISNLQNQLNNLQMQLNNKSKNISEFENEINLLNSRILLKNNIISEISDKFEKSSSKILLNSNSILNIDTNPRFKEITEENTKLKKENLLFLNEIERLKNLNSIIEKQNEMLELKIDSQNSNFQII